MPFHSHKLANGLQIIGDPGASARSVAVGFFVRTGSRDETPEVCGVSHFLEHMAFKGNDKRTAFDVNRDFDRIGADYNASTSEENTVYHGAVLPEYLPELVDILAGLCQPVLRQDDFDMEKQVIINEIGRYEDMPHWSAYDHAKRVHFGDHLLGNSILGTPASITEMKRDQMAAYHARRYMAPNITVAVAGAVQWEPFVDLIERQCGNWAGGDVKRDGLLEASGTGKLEILHKPKVAQEYVVMMSSGPAATSPLRYAADLLSMAIGDDSGSRLYWELVDPGHVDSADCSFHEYDGTGAFYTSYSSQPETAQENLQRIFGILKAVQDDGITAEELGQAKNKLLSRIVRSRERPKGQMFALGMNWVYQGQYRSVDDDLAAYEGVTLDDVRQVMERYPLTRQTILALGPLESMRKPE